MVQAPTIQDEVQEAIGRGAIYMLIAHALAYPSDQRLAALCDGLAPSLSEIETGDLALDESIAALLSQLATPTQDLRAAHVQQFTLITSPDCPAHETAYSERDAFRQAQQMADIAGFYRAWGFDIGGAERERPDQICVELEFMALLARKEAQALERGLNDALTECRRSQALFLSEHLGCWGASLGRRIAGQAAAPFYEAAGHLLATWLDTDLQRLAVEPSRLLDEPLPQPPPETDEDCGPEGSIAGGANGDEPTFIDVNEIR
jgi:DMSO reductase family type II enzyme chaperone